MSSSTKVINNVTCGDKRCNKASRESWFKNLGQILLRNNPTHRQHRQPKRCHENENDAQTSYTAKRNSTLPPLPSVLWTGPIFSYLDRRSQNQLAAAHPDVARARRSSQVRSQITWPGGCSFRVGHRMAKVLSRPVKKVVFSNNDSDTLWVVYCKGKLLRYDKLQGPQSPFPTGHGGVTADVKFCNLSNNNNHNNIHNSHNTLMATAGKSDGTIRLWKCNATHNTVNNNNNNNNNHHHDINNTQWQCFRVLQVYLHDLRHMTWCRTGDFIASWGQDGFVRVSNIHNGALKSMHWKTRMEVAGCHETVAFAPPRQCQCHHCRSDVGTKANTNTNTIALARNNEQVVLWNFVTHTVQPLPGPGRDEHGSYAGAYITSLAFSPNGQYLVVGCHVAMLKFWRLVPTHRQENHDDNDDDDNDDDDANDNPQQQGDDYQYHFEKQIYLGGGWSAVTLLTFSSDGHYLACTNFGTQIRIVDLDTGQVLATLQGGHTGRIESLCFKSDGRTLASGSCDRTVRLWDTSNLEANSY